MTSVQDIIKKCSPWMRISIGINIHVKKALINVLHNYINDTQVQALPADPAALYAFLQTNKRRIKNSKFIKEHQKSILLPASGQSVDSSSFDISLTRFLIQTFSGILNAKRDWKEPDPTDHTICAYVYRAAALRNAIFHDDNIEGMSAKEFEKKWKQLEEILQGLKYAEDIEPFKTETLDFKRCEEVILAEFVDHLKCYKEECLNNGLSQDNYILRRFSVDGNINDIVTESDLEILLQNNDCVIIHGEAGMGKSSTAKRLKNEWCAKKVFNNHNIIYYDSKKINKQLAIQSNAAALYHSEMGDYLKKKGRTIDDLSIYNCVKANIDDLIIVIDGVDEFPVKELVTGDYVDELEGKSINNKEITGIDTISAIYFGYIFPYSKVILLGRNGEFESLKKVKVKGKAAIFNRKTKILELLKFDDANIKDLSCLKLCQQPSRQSICTNACQEIYAKIKDIELCKNPSDLNSLLELHKKHPNENIGRITRTKLIIATLLNRLNEHIYQKNCFAFQTFHAISKQNYLNKYLKCIRSLREISFKSLLKDNVTVQVNEIRDANGIIFFEDENQIRIKRETFEELDLFYVRDLDYYFILEPHHTLNIEFLSACYLFSNPDEWDSILKLNKDRQLIIIAFIAGLHADDYFTKDFVFNVLRTSSYSSDKFFNWLYNVEDVRSSLPDGFDGIWHYRWFGLMETQKLSPSFFLMDFISNEVEIPKDFIPKTIVYYCNYSNSSEWYFMNFFDHYFLTNLSDRLYLDLFLNKFQQYDFIIKGHIWIENNNQFNLLNKFGNNNRITFRSNELIIRTSLNTSFSCNLNVNTLSIEVKCDSRTIDVILNAISPPPTNTSSSNPRPAINCKQLDIENITRFNSQQTKKLFELGLCGVVDSIRLRNRFFTDGQLAILKNAERKANKILNIELEFNQMFRLPNLASRHVSFEVRNVTDNALIKLREHIPLGYTNNLNKYRIIDLDVPFVRKEHSLQDCDQSMFLNLYGVNFKEVSDEEFAKTFSLVSSLSFWDDKRYFDDYRAPTSHWSRLSRIVDCRINEMRIWDPQPKNFEHFLNIKTNLLQLVCERKAELKALLNHIVTNTNVQLHKQINVFVVTYDKRDWNYYEEIPVFNVKTIEEYQNNYSSYDSLLDNISVSFHEGESHLNWCCEISVPNIDTNAYHHSESPIEEIENELSAIQIIGDVVHFTLPNIDSVNVVSTNDDEKITIVSDDKMTSPSCCCCCCC